MTFAQVSEKTQEIAGDVLNNTINNAAQFTAGIYFAIVFLLVVFLGWVFYVLLIVRPEKQQRLDADVKREEHEAKLREERAKQEAKLTDATAELARVSASTYKNTEETVAGVNAIHSRLKRHGHAAKVVCEILASVVPEGYEEQVGRVRGLLEEGD